MGRNGNRATHARAAATASTVLRRYRKASVLAVAVTTLLLLVVSSGSAEGGGLDALEPAVVHATDSSPTSVDDATGGGPPEDAPAADGVDAVAAETTDQARRMLSEVRRGARRGFPRFVLGAGILVFAWMLSRALRSLLRRTLGHWPRASAVTALATVSVWAFSVGLAVTVLAGDVRGFLGSVGLLGLALSWALQTPIESFTGWLLNAFKGHYRVGDRVEVGDVYGDVHRIDVLTTTVWEIGSPHRPGYVRAEQPTGRLITFPNNQILTGAVMNYTRDFRYVWDELSVPLAEESDVRYAASVLQRVADDLLGERMRGPARDYEKILARANVLMDVAPEPQVFASLEESWTAITIRYLVAARERRRWKSELVLRIADELRRPEHQGRIVSGLPRRQIQLVGEDGVARDWSSAS